MAWYLADRQGTVRDIADAAGDLLDHIDYDARGAVLAQSDPAAGDRFGYAGMQADAATGLDYDQARYYDPASGRFISQDPTGFAGGDTNLYRYAGNDPTNFEDPSGLLGQPVGGYSWPLWDATKAGFGAAWSGAGNVVTGALHTAWDLGAAPIDTIGTAVSQSWTPVSYAGAASLQAMQDGVSPLQIQGDVFANAGTLGLYGLGKAGINYIDTGDPTQFQQASGSFLASVATARLAGAAIEAAASAPSAAIIARDALVADMKAAGRGPSTVSGAEDIITGAVTAKPSAKPPAVVAPELAEAAKPLGGVGAKTPSGNTVGACSEFHAANDLLLNGSTLNNIRITPAVRPRTGQVIPRCPNCTAMFGPSK